MTGKIIKLTEEQLKMLRTPFAETIVARGAFKDAARWRMEAEKELWDILFDMYPEMRQYHCHYNTDTGEIQALRKRKETNND